MATPTYARNLRDAAFVKAGTLSNAATAAYSASIDLGQTRVQSLEQVEFEVAVPATATLVNTKVMTLSVEESADNTTFAAVDPAITTTITGTAGNVSAAKTVRFRLPSHTKRYVRIKAVTSADGGDNTATAYTFSALF
jgi:hypothetical protein